MAGTLKERVYAHFAEVADLARRESELRKREEELIRELREKERDLVVAARASLAAQGQPSNPKVIQREQARLRKRFERFRKARSAKHATTRHAKSMGNAGPIPSAEVTLIGMNPNTPSTPRYRRQIVTETIEHFDDSPDGLEGFEDDDDEHDMDDEEGP